MTIKNPIGAANDIINIGSDLASNPSASLHLFRDTLSAVGDFASGNYVAAARDVINIHNDSMHIPNLWDDLNQLNKDV